MTDELARVQAEIEAARQAQREAEARLAELQESEGARSRSDSPPSAAADATPEAAPPVAERFERRPTPHLRPPTPSSPSSPATASSPRRRGPARASTRSPRSAPATPSPTPALEMGALVNGDADAATQVRIPLAMVNRHGLIAGATGTGKTKTLQVLAEQLSAAGVPVFAADIKGDLSGRRDARARRATSCSRAPRASARPGRAARSRSSTSRSAAGHRRAGARDRARLRAARCSRRCSASTTPRSRASASSSPTPTSSELPLIDLKDLRELLLYLTGDEGKAELQQPRRHLDADRRRHPARAHRVQRAGRRRLLRRARDRHARAPAHDAGRPRRRQPARGAGRARASPALFSTFLMWLLADLFDDLPEVGDIDRPKLVFFFDEAHLLFADASKDFLTAITQTVRLIRSKGVGIFFVTQTPKDVPSDVLAQLGSRVQHQLRAHTPDDATALRQTVRTYPTQRLRPRGGAHEPRHRRGDRHGHERARRAHAGRLDAAAGAAGLDGADRRRP